ncbi:thiolase family protein [Brumicola pallidula]|uniref:Acetyl-CoA C-acetyltransferase n=1 Tax=Brumicola pallidula DSM 14239 = ACAM 615 TaxID=1121922 RepID=K6ZJF8_9ALTE|nr:thiolase family protein [Glaciecola pallidula]GAC29018.1 acetyl-CoA C-acetyltransferase [Glaciecola pallidula DSM 14239 = ACAM 615]
MKNDIYIIGVGLHKFGRTPDKTGLEQAKSAVNKALKDSKLKWQDLDFAVGGSQDAGNADSLINKMGATGLPFINVFNGCATGGSAMITGMNSILAGQGSLGLIVGFDKHDPGAFRVDLDKWDLPQWYGDMGFALTTQFFATKINRYMHDHNISESSLVRVAMKAFKNGNLNENAWRTKILSYDDIKSSIMINHPLTKYMFCSPSEGAAALIICNEEVANRYPSNQKIKIKACSFKSRREGTFEVFQPSYQPHMVNTVTKDAALDAFNKANISPEEIDIAQIQDTESGAEIMHMAELGLCEDGEQEQLLANNETHINGKLPINTDGGCLANGEPVGASGLRQIIENVIQLRGQAGKRQTKNPRLALSQVYGAPGISCVSILEKVQ